MSFSDLMSSAKGPGVIGLLLAFVVLGGFLVLGTLTLDEQFQGGALTAEGLVRRQANEIESLRDELKVLETKLPPGASLKQTVADLAKRKAAISSHQAQAAGMGVVIARTAEEIDALELAFADYKSEYRTVVRDAAKGKELGEFKTLDGQAYEQVLVREVNALGMIISHRDGVKRIPSDNLPLALQDLYQFDAEETKAEEAAEALVRKRHLLATAAGLEADRVQSEKNQVEQEREAKIRREQGVAALSSRLETLTSEIQKLEYNIRVESEKRFSRAPQLREQLGDMKRQKADLESKLNTLRSGR